MTLKYIVIYVTNVYDIGVLNSDPLISNTDSGDVTYLAVTDDTCQQSMQIYAAHVNHQHMKPVHQHVHKHKLCVSNKRIKTLCVTRDPWYKVADTYIASILLLLLLLVIVVVVVEVVRVAVVLAVVAVVAVVVVIVFVVTVVVVVVVVVVVGGGGGVGISRSNSSSNRVSSSSSSSSSSSNSSIFRGSSSSSSS